MEKIKKINSDLKKLSYDDDMEFNIEPDELSIFIEEFEQVLEQFSDKFDEQFGNIDAREYSDASSAVHEILNNYLTKF